MALGLRSLGNVQWLLCSPFHLKEGPVFLSQVLKTSTTSFGTQMGWWGKSSEKQLPWPSRYWLLPCPLAVSVQNPFCKMIGTLCG